MPPSAYDRRRLSEAAGGELEAFVAAGGWPLRPRLDRALALAQVGPGVAVVDIGSGRGEAAVQAARRGATVAAVDYSLEALDLADDTARRILPTASERRRIRLVAADATAIPLMDKCADRVLLLDVVEHLHPWQLRLTLREVERILADGGYVVVHTLPNRWALAAAYPILRLFERRLPAQPRSAYERAVHVNEQDPLSLRKALQEAGLTTRVWVEEWTTAHARFGASLEFPDEARSTGYPVLRRAVFGRAIALAMATPAGCLVGNDIFALAWRKGDPQPAQAGRFRPFRGFSRRR